MKDRLCLLVLSLVLFVLPVASPEEDVPHSRQKRFLWITNDGRLALPPGTTMTLTPSLSMPFVRYPPKGFLSNMSVSFPFTSTLMYMLEFKIDFDKLGLTDNENPYGTLPPVLGRSLGTAAQVVATEYIRQYMESRVDEQSNDREKRSSDQPTIKPELEKSIMDRFHGGERVLLYGVVEDLLTNFGMPGRDCLLRAICEINAHALQNFGFLGEVMKLFFTPSKSPYASLLTDFVKAETVGKETGECFPYMKRCSKSLFLPRNKYSKDAEELHQKEMENTESSNKLEGEIAM